MKKGTLRFILFAVVNVNINCATSLMESNGTAAKNIDGEMLLNIGRKLNKPMITLLGMAIRNLENLHPCDDWTQWSDCGIVREGYIATRKRTRMCGRNLSALQHGNKTTETDVSICEGFCPQDYNVTANGFCVKLYVSAKTLDGAQKQCREDGGHLINIDTDLKYGDVKAVLKGFSNHVFIDGHRKDSSSPWLVESGSEKSFFRWGSGEPDSYLCIIINYSNQLFYDYPCTNGVPFLCEKVQ